MAVKQRQSQKQNVNVNINLGEKKKKRKPRKRKTVMKRREGPQPLFNPPPIINFPPGFNQPNNFLIPPQPIQQKQYSVFPEAETALNLGLLPNVSVPLSVEGSPLKEKEKERKLVSETYTVINEPFKAPEEEYQLIERPEIAPAAPFVAEEPLFLPVGGEQINPAPFSEEGGTPSSAGAITDPFKPAQFPSANFPIEPYSPSTLSSSDAGGRQIEEFVQKYSLPSPVLSTISQSLPLPEIPKRTQKGLSAFFPILEGTAPPPAEPAKKKAGRPKGSVNKPKYEALVPEGQVQFAVPVKETFATSIPTEGTFSLSAPLAEQPLAQFLGTEKTFSTEPEKISGGLERRRRETALTPAEQTLLSNPLGNQPPLFA